MSGRFARVLRGERADAPPIWLMRQAGRYHEPYRRLREQHSFETLCRTPALAAEAAMAPVREFDFDAAILFSDLLFPLDALGMGLSYDDGPPKLDGPLTAERLGRFRPLSDALDRLTFQREAIAATRAALPTEKGLVGFVGGPWTLFVYAVEGTHAGPLARAKSSHQLYERFDARVTPLIGEMIRMQLAAGADLVMVFDTAAGELPPSWFRERVARGLTTLAETFPGRVGYYAKGMHPAHYAGSAFRDAPWAGLGFDARWDLAEELSASSQHLRSGFVQGNFDPALLFLTGSELAVAIDKYLEPFRRLDPAARRSWICGLGHGVLPGTPESSVRTFVRLAREAFA